MIDKLVSIIVDITNKISIGLKNTEDNKIEENIDKYAQIAYEYFCFNNNIPPYWIELSPELKDYWICLANSVIIEYKKDVKH